MNTLPKKHENHKGLHRINLAAILDNFIELKPICLNPRNDKDNCDRKEPCEKCEGCPHYAHQTRVKS